MDVVTLDAEIALLKKKVRRQCMSMESIINRLDKVAQAFEQLGGVSKKSEAVNEREYLKTRSDSGAAECRTSDQFIRSDKANLNET